MTTNRPSCLYLTFDQMVNWTLLDAPGRHERRTAIIGRELGRYNIDIAALSETRISGESEFVEVGAGYTFFCIGKPEGQPRQAGVGFAVRSSMLQYIQQSPIGISPRLMKLQLRLRSWGCTHKLLIFKNWNEFLIFKQNISAFQHFTAVLVSAYYMRPRWLQLRMRRKLSMIAWTP